MKDTRGFTLMEMLIVIIIISLVTIIVLVGYKDYGSQLNVRRSANEVALAIREAQANALAVKVFDPDGAGGVDPVYTSWGIYFTSASDNQFTMFVDYNGDKSYNSGASPTELVKTVSILNGVKIINLCKGQKNSSIETPQCSLTSSITSLDIVYQRPNPDTTLRARDGAGNNVCVMSGTCPDLEVILQGTDGTQRTVVVWSTGQISIE